MPATVDFTVFEEDAHRLLQGAVDAADLSGLEGRVQQTVVCSGPASALIEAAARSQVVVVGARGVGKIERFLLGSVSDQVAQHSSAPVIVVHPSAAA